MANRIRHLAGLFLPGGLDALDLFKTDHGAHILDRLERLPEDLITLTHLNQVLHLSALPGIGEGFFRYYFLEPPARHPYNVASILAELPDPHPYGIHSFEQLEWGIRRFLTDALLFFGDITTAYSELSHVSYDGLVRFFSEHSIDASGMKQRGPFLPLLEIPVDDRYLVAELACKAYDAPPGGESTAVLEALRRSYRQMASGDRKRFTVRELLTTKEMGETPQQEQMAFKFAIQEIQDEVIESEAALADRVGEIARRFSSARKSAITNCDLYLSLVHDLDVYVATSMRSREDFREMARSCKSIFEDDQLRSYHLRYFDPTRAASVGHEDKGIVECLMVKCAKVLIYFAGERESFGKDSEAAMALSQGKPVIIVCPDTDPGRERMRFFRDVHPLSRMIHMETGVAVGAMITTSHDTVVHLLRRVFNNEMEYDLEHDGRGYYRLRERLTESVVRLQTGSKLLRDTFWNYYHGLPLRAYR